MFYPGGKYIRRTQTRSTVTGETYFTYRLVRGERSGGKVRQITLLNLGRFFDLAQEHWLLLCERLEQLLSGQAALLVDQLPTSIETLAQRYAAQLITQGKGISDSAETQAEEKADFHEVDVHSLELLRPRSVGVEHQQLRRIIRSRF